MNENTNEKANILQIGEYDPNLHEYSGPVWE